LVNQFQSKKKVDGKMASRNNRLTQSFVKVADEDKRDLQRQITVQGRPAKCGNVGAG